LSVTQPPALRIPITNSSANGDYTAQIAVGSAQTPANVILDTGSSTLAVVPTVYDPSSDAHVQATPLAQDVIYGTGGWTGPVLQTQVTMGSAGASATVDAYIAVTSDDQPGDFGQADGIMGLAFNALNSAYNLESYLQEQGAQQDVTYPWPFQVAGSRAAIEQFGTFLSRMPEEDLPPYFTALGAAGVTRNIFAFYTRRSVPSATNEQLNSGFFILGGGPEQSDLYTGEFVDVKVVDDLWYNTNLLSVQVGQGNTVAVPQLSAKDAKTAISNSIVDSGTNSLYLSAKVFDALMSGFQALPGSFVETIQSAGQQGGVPNDSLNLEDWPNITFALEGATVDSVPLTCSPSTYWQLDAPNAGVAQFMIFSSPMPQSILGLPLMNNYYTVFDRTQNPYGAIRFAAIAAPS